MHQVCDATSEQTKLQHRHIFQANGFTKDLVQKIFLINPFPINPPTPPHTRWEPTSDDPSKILCVPYIRGLNEKLERVCTPFGVRAVFNPMRNLKQPLIQVKTHIPVEKRSGLVYKSPAKSAVKLTLRRPSPIVNVFLGGGPFLDKGDILPQRSGRQ